MSKDKIDEIEKKKQELEAELERIQGELDHSLDEVRTDVSSKLDPAEFIRKHPIPVVGTSLLLGFLAGHRRPGSSSAASGREKNSELPSILWTELKKIASKKAVTLATDYIENVLEKKIESDGTTENRNGTPSSN